MSELGIGLPFIQQPVVISLIVLGVLLLIIRMVLQLAKFLLAHSNAQQMDLIEKIDNLLPQTQCGRCGYAGCLPYAEAIAEGAAINQCPPGGQSTIKHLSNLLNYSRPRLNPAHGKAGPILIATIREAECIGCTKCIQVCPTDAILGGPKLMHSILVSECTGCDLCLEPCPVDCIDLIPLASLKPQQHHVRTAH